MHPCLNEDAILRFIASKLVESGLQRTAVALARCCRAFEDPVLDVLWETKRHLIHLLGTFPRNIWGTGKSSKSLIRPPAVNEWARLWKYAQRVRAFMPSDPLPLQILSVLQFHTPRQPLLPNLESLHMFDTPVTRDTISFIPLLLSTRITTIELKFINPTGQYKVMAASMIANLPITCPDLREIRLEGLPRDQVIVRAVSQSLIANRGTLRSFHADSVLTPEACRVLYRCPDLRYIHTVMDGATSLPTMVLPNLTGMVIKFYHCRGLQGFRRASLGNLVSLSFRCEFEPIGGFLEEFERVALTTSIPTTLSTFSFRTARTWRPKYRTLLRFTHLTSLEILFPCASGCSSTIDDDTIADLAQALCKLEFLRLGGSPCDAPTGVTVKGLSALAYHCPHLRNLRIHFQVATLDPPEIPFLASAGKSREGCVLTFLDVGCIRVPEGSTLMVALTLLRIFPNLEFIHHSDIGWEKVAHAISGSKKFVSCSRPGALVKPDE